MAKTRSKGGPSTASTNSTSAVSTASKYSLSTESENPPKLFILPKKAKPESRVVSLLNPRYSRPTRYLVCPETGTYEFVKISAPKTTPRSWLIEGASTTSDQTDDAQTPTPDKTFEAHVTKGADLYVATPIDPMFLILPALASQLSSAKRLFLSSDDHFDSVADEAPHMSEILRCSHTRKLLETRMGAVCDTVEAGDEHMYRVSEEKVLSQVLSKAKAMSDKGLPASMEEKFVKKALEAPISSVKRENPTLETAGVAESGPATPLTESAESQSSVSTVDSSTSQVSDASTAATSVADESEALNTGDVTLAMQASQEIVKLQRLRVAFNFICSNYVPAKLTELLKKLLAEGKGSVDFKPLDQYVEKLTKLRQEATLARSASDYSRKRTRDEEDEDRAEKRRKKEEEDKRKKANESRGVKELKKVNTSGMMKLSAFFKKK